MTPAFFRNVALMMENSGDYHTIMTCAAMCGMSTAERVALYEALTEIFTDSWCCMLYDEKILALYFGACYLESEARK